MDYGDTKIPSMHLYPRRRNVAAEVAEELKTVTYATPQAPMEERRKKEKNHSIIHSIIQSLIQSFNHSFNHSIIHIHGSVTSLVIGTLTK